MLIVKSAAFCCAFSVQSRLLPDVIKDDVRSNNRPNSQIVYGNLANLHCFV